MKCIIVDDEPLARDGIEMLTQMLPYLEIVGSFGSAVQTLEFIQSNEVDLIFLDIELPGLSGLDFLRSIKSDAFVILTTAYPQYALEAFELDVIDYLVKPIKNDRFIKAVSKVKEIYDLKISSLYEFDPKDDDHIFIRSERKYVKLYYADIVFIQGLKDYVMIHTLDKKYLTAMNIKTILSKLPDAQFIRSSKSHIVNIPRIQEVNHDSITIGGHEIPLGNSYKSNFKEKVIRGKLLNKK